MTIVLGVVVLVFVFWGIGSMTQQGAEYVAKVEGQVVTQSEYQRAYQNMLETYKRMFRGQLTPEMIQRMGIKKRALEELVTNKLLSAEANRLGLLVTDAELAIEISKFLGGTFTRAQYLEALRLKRLSPLEFESSYREELLIRRLIGTITDSISVGEDELKNNYLFENEKVSIYLVQIPFADMIPRVRVSADQLRAYYEKNKERYRQPERVRLEILSYPSDHFIALVKPTEEEIKSYYYLNLEEKFTTQKEIHARHILFRLLPGADAKKRVETRARAERVLAMIRGGKDFAQMAKIHSEDTSNAQSGGDLGFFKKGQMVPLFEKAAYALKAGELSDVVETPFGFHLIKTEEVREGQRRPLGQVREEIIQAIKRDKSKDATVARATKDREQAMKGVSLPSLAKPFGLKVMETNLFSKSEIPTQFQAIKDFGSTVFALSQGQVGDVMETPDGLVLFRLKEKKASSDSPFEEVREQVADALRNAKAQERAKIMGSEILAKLKEGKSLWEVASKMGLKVEETSPFGRNVGKAPDIPALRQDAFTLSPRQTHLNKLYTLKGDVFVAAFKERLNPDLAEFEKNKETLRSERLQRKRAEVLAQYQNALKAKAIERGELLEDPGFLSRL
jgi:peptidyl-prolyl cis-trans isomerase D